jgi:hypothetical protein
LCLTEDQTEVLKNKIINDLSSIIKNKEEIIGVPLFLEACIKNATTINEAIYASFLVGAASQDTYSHKDSLLIDNY